MRSGRRAASSISRLATRFFPTTSSSSATRSSRPGFRSSRTIPIRCPSRSIPRRGPSGRRSGRCATSASNIFRPASCISSIGGFHTDSNGCAAGNTRDEAIVQGFLELVERDAYAIWWYNRVQRAEVDLGQFDDSLCADLKAQFAEAGRKLWVLDITKRSRHSDLRGDRALDAERTREYRVRFRRAFRSPHRLAALAHRAEPVPVRSA